MEHGRKKSKTPEDSQFKWEKITSLEAKFNDYELPSVTVIIPTFNSSQSVKITLESVLSQEYPDFEVIIVDGGSQDRTLELIRGIHDPRIITYSIHSNNRYEMLNKGLLHATGLYVCFLFPGDFYIHPKTLRYMMSVVIEKEYPDLAYCGTLIRDGRSTVKILFRDLSLKRLHRGNQPTSLQSCWFRREVFKTIGKFSSEYTIRGGFDLFCRFLQTPHLRHVSTYRVLTDYDLRLVTKHMVIRHFWETFRTIQQRFGPWVCFLWLFRQKDTGRLFKHWVRSVRVALVGR